MSSPGNRPKRGGTSRVVRAAAIAVAVLTLAALAAESRLSAQLIMASQPRRAYQEAYLLPEPEAMRALGLGNDELMADLVWLRALSYFAVHFHFDQDYRWLDRYIDTIIALDPKFRMIYHWAGVVAMYGGQVIDNRAVMTSIRFLEMGRERYPDDWLLNFMLGINYGHELVPENEAQRRAWSLLSATYLAHAAAQPEAPSWLALAQPYLSLTQHSDNLFGGKSFPAHIHLL